jgi:hypothetical protein
MRETQRTQQQPIPTYRGPYSTAAAARTWPHLRFHSQFWQSVFAFLKGSFSQNLFRWHVSLIAEKLNVVPLFILVPLASQRRSSS